MVVLWGRMGALQPPSGSRPPGPIKQPQVCVSAGTWTTCRSQRSFPIAAQNRRVTFGRGRETGCFSTRTSRRYLDQILSFVARPSLICVPARLPASKILKLTLALPSEPNAALYRLILRLLRHSIRGHSRLHHPPSFTWERWQCAVSKQDWRQERKFALMNLPEQQK